VRLARRRPALRWWWFQRWCSVVAGVEVVGANGFGLRAGSWRSAGSAWRGRFRAIGRTVCSRLWVDLRRTIGWTWPPMRPTSAGGRVPATRSAEC
jgi:hypothetical protein